MLPRRDRRDDQRYAIQSRGKRLRHIALHQRDGTSLERLDVHRLAEVDDHGVARTDEFAASQAIHHDTWHPRLHCRQNGIDSCCAGRLLQVSTHFQRQHAHGVIDTQHLQLDGANGLDIENLIGLIDRAIPATCT